MFDKADKEKLILQQRLDEAEKLLREIEENRQDVFIVKLFPDNPDQFELNGEFIVDESSAVFKSHKPSFSEAVMFKAGKESATKAFEADKGKLLSQIDSLQLENSQLKAQQTITDKAYEDYKRDALKNEVELNKSIASYASKLQDAVNDKDDAVKHYEGQILLLQKEIDELKSSVDYWKTKAMTDVDLSGSIHTDIYTPYGVVRKTGGN